MTRELGGYYVEIKDKILDLKIPARRLGGFWQRLEDTGEITTKKIESYELKTELVQVRSALKADEQLFGSYMDILSKAGRIHDILEAEIALNNLVQQIEYNKGRRRMLTHSMKFARVKVYINHKSKQVVAADEPSSFEWLNTVSINQLIGNGEEDDAYVAH